MSAQLTTTDTNSEHTLGIVYVILPLTSSNSGETAQSILQPYLDAVLTFTQTPEGAPATPLSTSFYFERQPSADVPGSQASQETPRYIVTPPLVYSTFPDLPDTATANAEVTFQRVVKSLRAIKGDPVRDDEELDFWPPIEVEDSSDDES